MFLCSLYDLFFCNDTTTTNIYTYLYTLSLHDALPISDEFDGRRIEAVLFVCLAKGIVDGGDVAGVACTAGKRDLSAVVTQARRTHGQQHRDRKSTRLNSSQ